MSKDPFDCILILLCKFQQSAIELITHYSLPSKLDSANKLKPSKSSTTSSQLPNWLNQEKFKKIWDSTENLNLPEIRLYYLVYFLFLKI